MRRRAPSSTGPGQRAVGLVLTGGYEPRAGGARTRSGGRGCSRRSSPDDTYTVASEIHDLLVKTHASDTGKIELIKELVWDELQLNPILEVGVRRGLRLAPPAHWSP